MTPTCPSCGSRQLRAFHSQDRIPVNSCLLLESRQEAADFPRGDLELMFCESCGFIFNAAFDRRLSEYSTRYEETQGFSPHFRAFARTLAGRWIDRYDLRDKELIEVGCGKGEFLVLMCELGNNRGIGIDPSYRPERTASDAAARLSFIQDFYSERYAHLTGDAIICRHTLEHIPDTKVFMDTIRRSVGDRRDTIVLFELPDVYRVLRDIAFWDIYYEHCSYFTLGSLSRLFRQCGFDVFDLSVDYDDQYLLLEARPGSGHGSPFLEAESDLERTARAVDSFQQQYPARIDEWRSQLHSAVHGGSRTVIWGAGSKGVSYLTTLGVTDEIECAVDINPYKQGMYMAGTGHPVVAPEFLKEYRPDVVIAMNSVYLPEIAATLSSLGVDAELRGV
jgi:SAM-dependent methyltransferase